MATETLTYREKLARALDDPDTLDLHNWGGHNSIRKYTSLVSDGRSHPFRQAGSFQGFHEDEEDVQHSIKNATTERIALKDLVATKDVTPQHVGLLIQGKAPEPRTGNAPWEDTDKATVVRVGKHPVLVDGHHRASSEWAKGATHMKARVLSGVTPVFHNDGALMFHDFDYY